MSVLLALLLVTIGLPVVHDHDLAGVYDEDCPLDRLAGGVARVTLPTLPDVPTPLPAIEPAPPAPRPAPASHRGTAAASRAPPAAA